MNKNKKIVVEFTNERIIPASGLAVVGAIFRKRVFVKQLNWMDIAKNAVRMVVISAYCKSTPQPALPMQ